MASELIRIPDEMKELCNFMQLRDGNIGFLAEVPLDEDVVQSMLDDPKKKYRPKSKTFIVIYNVIQQKVIDKIQVHDMYWMFELSNGTFLCYDHLDGEIYSRDPLNDKIDGSDGDESLESSRDSSRDSFDMENSINFMVAGNGCRYDWLSTIRTMIELKDGDICTIVSTNRPERTKARSWIEIWDPTVKEGDSKTVFTMEGDRFDCMIQLDDERIVLGSEIGKIYFWSRDSGKIEKTINAHEDRVLQLIKMSNGNFISNSKDKTIKIWSPESDEPIRTFNSDGSKVILLSNDRFMTYSEKENNIWSLLDGNLLGSLPENKIEEVIQLNDGRILTCNEDEEVKVWNI